jgi:oligopeptidase B
LAYTLDIEGSEKYLLFIKDLITGEFLKDKLPLCADEIEWANDNNSLFYLTLDHISRPYQVFQHKLGVAQDRLILEDLNEQFWVSLSKSNSGKYIFINASSSETSEHHYIDADKPFEDVKCFSKRQDGQV